MGEAVRTLDKHEIDYLLIGGQASALLGRPRCSSDIDLLVAPEDAPPALDALARAGFRTEKVNPHWLFKAFARDVLIDLMFKVRGEIYLDDEMLRRSSIRRFRGMQVTLDGASVTLRGVVQTNERKWRIESLSRMVSQGLSVVNEITVCPPGSPAAPENLS